MANILGQSTGYKGYKNNLYAATPGLVSQANFNWSFSPGEGIVSAMPISGSNTPPASGENIKYIGISNIGTEDRIAPYTGIVSLVYNSSSNTVGGDESGFIANIETMTDTPSILRSISPVNSIPSSYPVDIHFIPGSGISPDSHSIQKQKTGLIGSKQ